VDFFVNLRQRRYERGTIVFLKQGSIVQFERISEDFELSGVTFSNNDLYLALNGRVPSSLQGYMADIAIFATEEETATFDLILHAMWNLFHEDSYSKEAMSGLFKAAVLYIDHLNSRHHASEHNSMSHEQTVFNRFIRLVNDYARKEHNIDFYAGHLCLTPRYFGTLVKKVSGRTPKEWIDQQLMTEAKVMLKHTDQQVTRIADELGFPNSSFFCKYFRRIAGVTPQDYRTG
jgi:AraC family transcriptional activator of pobA